MRSVDPCATTRRPGGEPFESAPKQHDRLAGARFEFLTAYSALRYCPDAPNGTPDLFAPPTQ